MGKPAGLVVEKGRWTPILAGSGGGRDLWRFQLRWVR